MRKERTREQPRDAKAVDSRPGSRARHASDDVTEAMDQVLAQLDEPIDGFVAAAARRILERVEW